MRTSSTGRPITGKTCDCGRPAVVMKWGNCFVCDRCHRCETEYYTVGSKWEINIVKEPKQEDASRACSAVEGESI